MDRTIAFDHKVGFAAVEVNDVIAELMLSPELESKESAITQQSPQQVFGRRLVLTKLAGEGFLSGELKPTPIVSALSHGDRSSHPRQVRELASSRALTPSKLWKKVLDSVFLPSPLGRRAGDEGSRAVVSIEFFSPFSPWEKSWG
jgi:hypothetical protein